MTRYETPNALRHDAHTLVEDARALLDATADVTDEKVTEARQRLNEALEGSRTTYKNIQEKAKQGAQAVDQAIRNHPYQSMAIAFGVGSILGLLWSRRSGE